MVVKPGNGVAEEAGGLCDRPPVAEVARNGKAFLEPWTARVPDPARLSATSPTWRSAEADTLDILQLLEQGQALPGKLGETVDVTGEPDCESETTERSRDALPVFEPSEDLQCLLEGRLGENVFTCRPRDVGDAAEGAGDAALVADFR